MKPLLTVGHGTLDQEAFADLLRHAGVEGLVDVRRFPGSRRHPHFARDAMASWLPDAGVAYRWEEALGGRRSRQPDSPNSGLRNDAFRGYADYMLTPPFWQALDGVLTDTRREQTAILCAESVWWRCHRRLVADAVVLVAQQPVEHLLHDGRRQSHPVTDSAHRETGRVLYDAGPQRPLPGVQSLDRGGRPSRR